MRAGAFAEGIEGNFGIDLRHQTGKLLLRFHEARIGFVGGNDRVKLVRALSDAFDKSRVLLGNVFFEFLAECGA